MLMLSANEPTGIAPMKVLPAPGPSRAAIFHLSAIFVSLIGHLSLRGGDALRPFGGEGGDTCDTRGCPAMAGSAPFPFWGMPLPCAEAILGVSGQDTAGAPAKDH